MYSIDTEKMFYDIADDQAIVIDSETGVYFAMNTPGTLVFEQFVHGISAEEVVRALEALEGCPPDIGARVADFAAALVGFNILRESCAPGEGEAVFDAALMGDFSLEMDRFEDAIDLMMADPIHDIDLTQGWPVLKEDE